MICTECFRVISGPFHPVMYVGNVPGQMCQSCAEKVLGPNVPIDLKQMVDHFNLDYYGVHASEMMPANVRVLLKFHGG